VFDQFGDLEPYALRPGNVHSAEGRRDVLELVIARYRTTMKRRYFRADAAFASPAFNYPHFGRDADALRGRNRA
jgi:hypothetical protein